VESRGKGTFCFVLAEFDHVRAGFSALGEIGKRAEQVADEAVDAFLHYWHGGGALDLHLSDQVLLPMALAAGESAVTVSAVTDHLKTNLWAIQQFIPAKFSLREDPGKTGGRLQVSGIGYHCVI
jgi:RNA 3'-terminal phosphate cyclase (ATP)